MSSRTIRSLRQWIWKRGGKLSWREEVVVGEVKDARIGPVAGGDEED